MAVTEQFEIRRRRILLVLITVVPLGLAAVYAWFALTRDVQAAWGPVGLLTIIGLVGTAGFRDARAPIFVADEHGIRLREGRQWVGLLWDEMSDIRIVPRAGLVDPKLEVVGRSGRQQHSVSIGFTTTVSPEEVKSELARRWKAAAY